MANRVELTLAAAADAIFPLIAAFIALQTEWSLYDDISAHVKVYRCVGGTVPFYMEVDNTTSQLVIVKLSTGWNTGTHVYSGYKTLAQWMAVPAGAYAILGDLETMLIYSLDCTLKSTIYAGYITPLDPLDTNAIVLSGTLSSGGAYGAFHPLNTTQLWLFGRISGNGSIIKCAQDAQALYSYNMTTGQIYLSRIHLANADESSRYRGYPKYLYNSSLTLPSGISLGDGITVSTKVCRMKMNSTNAGAIWFQWEA